MAVAVCLGTQVQACDAFIAIKNAAPVEGATCTDFVAEGGHAGRSCYWQFDFRADRATAFAATLWKDLTSCHAGVADGVDQLVNHPDSYDLRTWVTGDGDFYVSVKDKGQLGKTLVFLRHVQAP